MKKILLAGLLCITAQDFCADRRVATRPSRNANLRDLMVISGGNDEIAPDELVCYQTDQQKRALQDMMRQQKLERLQKEADAARAAAKKEFLNRAYIHIKSKMAVNRKEHLLDEMIANKGEEIAFYVYFSKLNDQRKLEKLKAFMAEEDLIAAAIAYEASLQNNETNV